MAADAARASSSRERTLALAQLQGVIDPATGCYLPTAGAAGGAGPTDGDPHGAAASAASDAVRETRL